MLLERNRASRRVAVLAAVVLGSVFQLGVLESCNDALVTTSRYFDPCGTIFSNCNPGDVEVWASDVGDYFVDPACTVPGQCGDGDYQPLGTIIDLRP